MALLLLGVLVGCGAEAVEQPAPDRSTAATGAAARAVDFSDGAQAGEVVFAANCAVCHGSGATGTNLGPALTDRVYHPGHHADASIRIAVLAGVRQHHWGFGDMPAVAGVSAGEIEQVICYVRELQYANGTIVDASLLPEC